MTRHTLLHVMDGAGNAYAFADMRAESADSISALAADAHAISADLSSDGLIMACPPTPKRHEQPELAMRIHNADGSEGRMCGNGLRCLAHLARERWGISRDRWCVETAAGIRTVEFHQHELRVSIGDARVTQEQPWVSAESLPSMQTTPRGTLEPILVDVGNPHLVIFAHATAPWTQREVRTLGPTIAEDHGTFPHGVNVQFAYASSRDRIDLMSWERGSGFTLACGTGACAAVAAGWHHDRLDPGRIGVFTPGGELVVQRDHEALWLAGPVRYQRAVPWPPMA